MERIVVGVDGSEGARRALLWAMKEARLRGASIEAVNAWHVPYLDYGAYVPAVDPAIFHAAARQVLNDAVGSVDQSGLVRPIECAAAQGTAAVALFEVAKGADLLVVGARGLGGFTGLLLGSVSHQVAQHHGCPVVIVPPED
jgi:nucleotide-binding universal stress UspA family protein